MQRAYLGKLLELAEKDHNVLHILADSGTGFDVMFERNFPDQIVNFGISEEHMIAAAAGMATCGKIPFVYTAGAFLAYRAFEFIRDDVCIQNLNVKIVGMGSGLSWSSLGPTHHTTEDIAVLRSLPNLMILSPATPRQVMACVEKAYEREGPVYIRIGMNNEKEFFDESYDFKISGFDKISNGRDAIIVSSGSILEQTEKASAIISKAGYDVGIWSVNTIKPFKEQFLTDAKEITGILITVEEHQKCGGLGSIINDAIMELGIEMKNYRIGLDDTFAYGYGKYADVRKRNGLNAEAIAEKVISYLKGSRTNE